ncbi:MAG: hypothetical protein ACYC1S_09085 [Gemmatimonadaceae bacterium]
MPATFPDRLLKRLKVRRGGVNRPYYYLDLRHSVFGNLGRLPLRDPQAHGSPEEGVTTENLQEAKRWVHQHYAAWVWAQAARVKSMPSVAKPTRRTVSVVGQELLARRKAIIDGFAAEVGEDAPAVLQARRNHASVVSRFRRNIEPQFGKDTLKALTTKVVQDKLSALATVEGSAATEGQKRNVLALLRAIWRAEYPDARPPFSGVTFDERLAKLHRMHRVYDADIEDLLRPQSGAMSPKDVLHVLAVAHWYDEEVLGGRPNVAAVAVPNTAHAIALQIGLGPRLQELVGIRWRFVVENDGYVIVPNTKAPKRTPVRAVPLQDAVRPWLAELREREPVELQLNAFVIRTNRKSAPTVIGTAATLAERYDRVLQLAGCKPPGKSTHWARATHATWGAAATDVVHPYALKAYIGHASPWGGETDRYVATLLELMTDSHRRYIQHLPSPSEVRAAAATLNKDALRDRLRELDQNDR